MNIDMYVGSSQAQASSVKAMCQKQIQGYQQLQQAINQFVMSSGELQGKTYDSAKQYFSAVLQPLAKGGMLLAEATAKACQKFPDDYQSQVDSGDLKSSELEEQIQQYQKGIDTANAIIQALSATPEMGVLMKAVLRGVKDVKEGQEKAKKKLDKKLKKLKAFHASSPSIFSEIASLESAINTGAAQAATCWNGSTGTFSVPRQEEMTWVSEINGYEDRAKKQAEKEKMKELEKYNIYAVPCRDSDGKPTVMWLLEDPKSGRKVNNPELLEFLNMKGAKLDPNMFQILTLDGFEEKVAGSWRKGVEYFSGKEYTGLQKIGVQGLQGIQDFAESDYAELLRLMGFAYGIYRITTANGPIEVEVKPKVNVVSNKKFKNATLVNGKNVGGYKKVSGSGVPKNSKNSAQYQQYKNELMEGDILENSKPIISGSDLKDPKVISELTKNGSTMSDWAKMESTYSYETSMGKGKIHYYKNLKTGEISFYDVKMKVPIPKDLKIRNGLTDDFWIIDLDNNFIPKGVR